jgi:hypothetical protein
MLSDAPRNFYPSHEGHLVVNDGNVRPLVDSNSDSLFAIARLGDDFPTGTPFQHGTQSRSHRFVIVSYKNSLHDRSRLQTDFQCRCVPGIIDIVLAFGSSLSLLLYTLISTSRVLQSGCATDL